MNDHHEDSKNLSLVSNYSDLKKEFYKAYSESILKLSEHKFFAKNIETGEKFDLRETKINSIINPNVINFKLNVEQAWKHFWKKVNKNNEELWDAAELGNIQKIYELFDKEINLYPLYVNSKLLDNWTALHLAASEGYKEIVRFLLENDADVESKTSMERTALHLAALRGNIGVFKTLIEFNASINAQDNDYNTPIHYASENGNAEIIRFVLEEKKDSVDLSLKNWKNMTAIDLSCTADIRKIFEDYETVNENTLNGYSRMYIGGILRKNSRNDHVEKLLFLSKKKATIPTPTNENKEVKSIECDKKEKPKELKTSKSDRKIYKESQNESPKNATFFQKFTQIFIQNPYENEVLNDVKKYLKI